MAHALHRKVLSQRFSNIAGCSSPWGDLQSPYVGSYARPAKAASLGVRPGISSLLNVLSGPHAQPSLRTSALEGTDIPEKGFSVC